MYEDIAVLLCQLLTIVALVASTFYLAYRCRQHEIQGNEEKDNQDKKYPEKHQSKVHSVSPEKISYIGHPFEFHDIFQLNKDHTEICVNIGSGEFEIFHYQDYEEWLETQDRYMDIYNVFKDLLIFNFKNLYEPCPILHTFEQFIKDTGENGFATKGYHLTQHVSLFNQGVFVNDDKYENYFLFLGKFNTAIYFTKCCKEPGEAVYYSAQNIQMTNALHEELQSKDIIQINCLVDNDILNESFCTGCTDSNLYIKEEILRDIDNFKSWWSNFQNVLHNLKTKRNLSMDPSSIFNVVQNIKKKMITYEALRNYDFPSFSILPKAQATEMRKCILLSLHQYEIFHTDCSFIFVRGPYGSGKSLVLKVKLENIVKLMSLEDILYFICNDQQSKLTELTKIFKLRYPNNLIIVCNSKCIVGGLSKPKLSLILNHIHNVWKGRTVHVLIDEFNGSFITKKEVLRLKEILPKFSNSFIIIALQSVEELACENSENQIDLGYRYDLLQDDGFSVFNLIYCFRCAVEINKFVKITSEIIENAQIPVNEFPYEKETTRAYSNIKKKFAYVNSNQTGHNVQAGPVSVFIYSKFSKTNQSYKKSNNSGNGAPIPRIYIAVLEYILADIWRNERYVICTFDEELYNSVYFFLQNQPSYNWTSDVKEFVKKDSQFNILLTDHASIRGYTFPNVVFLLRMPTQNILYKVIECCTRATTKLYVITDNVNTSQDSVENQLIKTWKLSDCVKYFSLQYHQQEDRLFILHDNEIEHSRSQLMEITVENLSRYSSSRFLWSLSDEEKQDKDETKNVNELSDAIYCICGTDDVNTVCELFKVNDTDIRSYKDTFDGRNLFHMASTKGSVNILKFMIDEFGWDVNCETSRYKDTPLHLASSNGHTEAIELLLQNNADINAKNFDGSTPLHSAVIASRIQVIEVLLENNASLLAEDKFGRTPLLLAGITNQREIVDIIRNYKSRN